MENTTLRAIGLVKKYHEMLLFDVDYLINLIASFLDTVNLICFNYK